MSQEREGLWEGDGCAWPDFPQVSMWAATQGPGWPMLRLSGAVDLGLLGRGGVS